MKRITNGLLFCALLVAAMAFAPAAQARGERPQRPGGDISQGQRPDIATAAKPGDQAQAGAKKRGRNGPRRLGKGKEAACVRSCGEDQRLCIGVAREDAKACTEENCDAQSQAQCEACSDDRASASCSEARDEARACSLPCRESLADLGTTCREAATGCIESCPDAERKDRTCARECRGELRECRAPSRDAARECNEGCAGLREEAKLACDADRCSVACENAREEARTCRSNCREDSAGLDTNCRNAADACLEECPGAS